MNIPHEIIIPAVASLIAAVIGGLLGLLGSLIATKKQIQNKTSENNEIAERFINSILIEIECIHSRYKEFSKIIRSKNDYLDCLMYINEDYFSVYHNNSGYLGLIKNDELRNNIIKFYTQAKGLIDTIRTNTKLLEELHSNNPKNRQDIHLMLCNYLIEIKNDDANTMYLYQKIQESKELHYL